ncbi:MAG: ExeM/NucH family extracellular endonuclease [Acidobacteria bacterium]|nr:ExeM/NucH family extracellular endonuclease [Acidobacteriota bacterium]MBV9477672.1 ExeM/NucH family extracellular endonuclease [Acidobacteriota bacterium]
MLISATPRLAAQCVSLTTLGSAYTQNFDTLANTGTTNNLTIPGWFLTEGGGGARDNEQYATDNGASTTGDMYSYGAAASTERALGQLRSGTLIPLFGSCYTNNTGATIGSLAVAYNGEEWRLGTAGRTDQMNFEYSLNATDLVTGTWTNVAALNFVTPDTATVGAKNGNAAADRTAISSTVSSLSIPNGATFWIRWNDTDATGADDGLAVDDFSLTPNGAVVLPNLTIDDVSLSEGNAGTTSFTFTVSLSAPAGPGGVTFDIATADGTATQPSDYTQKSLTSQTIPAGSSTYSFTVLVNGDTSPETNETFFVNVTNVTGANVTDGQGQGTIVNDDAAPNLTINDVSHNEGNAGTTTYTFTVSLSAPAGAGGVTFDIATADGTAVAPGDYTSKSLTSQTIPAGSSTYTFDVLVNGDTTPETDETFFVNVTNITNAIGTDTQGVGTIVNDDITKIHDVQGNGASSPLVGQTVSVEGVVTANFQGANKLQGFFLQEEDADVDADPATSEGVFVFCNTCPTAVAEGQRVRATGTVSEFNGKTEITASTAPSVTVTDAANHIAEVTPATVVLPVIGDINTFYEKFEGMRVMFQNLLTVSEYFELGRYGQIELYSDGRPLQYTEANAPSVAGNVAYADELNRRRVILDDDNNAQESYLLQPDGSQAVYHPHANGGFSVGTQGVDFFRGGDVVNALTGVLDWSFAGQAGTDAWRVRPTLTTPVTFTVANPRPVTPPAVGGAIRAVGMNMLNYFTTIDTTSSNSSGPCGPSGGQDCRGADSVAELNRQRERASIVICSLNPDVAGLMEMENTTATTTINDLLGAVNARCGGAHPYAFVNTGGTLGTDAIRVFIIYRTGILSPVGSPLVDLDPIHNRPPTAQTFDVVDSANPAFGQRFTFVANHFKSKGCDASATGADADNGDGQGCYNGRRTSQASRLLTWINGTVIPAAGDPDVLLVGDFNAYAHEDPVTTLEAGGYTDLETFFHGNATYSYLFDGQLGHLDYGFASASLVPHVTEAQPWHINADEVDLFDYNDEVKDTGESTFEEKPDGSALTPPRVVFAPGTPYRASDHDPVLVGLFTVADLAITKTDSPDPVTAGANLTYTINVTNNGPDAADTASWTDTLPTGTTFVSLSPVAGWSCTTPAVGANGTISCTNATFAVGSAMFTLTVNVAPSVAAGTVLSNTASITSNTGDGSPGNESATTTTTVATSADLSVTKTDSPDPVTAGNNLTYTITVNNAGPSFAATVSLADTLPAGTTFVSLASPGGWSCTNPAVGATGSISCTIASLGTGDAVFTLVVNVGSSASGTLSNTATVTSATSDPNTGNESATETTAVTGSADLSVTKTDSPDPVTAGTDLTYTITVNNAGPSVATSASLSDTLPAGTTFVSLSSPGGWSCTAPAVGAAGTVSCSNASLATGNSVFTLVVHVGASTTGSVSNTATVSSATSDPNPGNESATASTTVVQSSDLAITKTDSPDPVNAGAFLDYSINVTNNGPSDVATITFTDAIPTDTTFAAFFSPSGWDCTLPPGDSTGTVSCSTTSPLAAGATSNFTLRVKVGAGVAAGTVITNTANLTSASDSTAGNNSATATTTVATSADLSVTKVDTPDPVGAGNNLTYTITVDNAGPSNASTVSLSDTLPAGTTFVSLSSPGGWSCTAPAVGAAGTVTCSNASFANGGNAVFTLVVQANGSLANGTVLSNTATVSSTTSDPTPGNNSATATTTIAVASADLAITKTDSPDPVNAGANLTYTIAVTNNGPDSATTVTLSDPLPAGTTYVSITSPGGWVCTTPSAGANGTVTCTNASLATGTSNFTIVVAVSAATAPGTILTNTATVSSATTDPTPGNNSATATTTVLSPATLSAVKTASGTFQPGSALTYTIVLSNSGPSAQFDNPGHELTDVLPAQVHLVSATATSGTPVATVGTNTVTWDGNIPAGGSVTITIHATVDSNVAPGTTVSNQASFSYDADGNGTNESSGSSTNGSAAGPTTFSVAGAASLSPIPTLDPLALAALATLLALVGALFMRRN